MTTFLSDMTNGYATTCILNSTALLYAIEMWMAYVINPALTFKLAIKCSKSFCTFQ